MSLCNSVRTRTRCTGETRQQRHYCVSETFIITIILIIDLGLVKILEKSKMWAVKLYLVSCIWQQVVHREPTQLQKMLCCVVRLVELCKK